MWDLDVTLGLLLHARATWKSVSNFIESLHFKHVA